MPVFFFFQAEDGIRDYKVTGVQTCALPILHFGGRCEEESRTFRLREAEGLMGAERSHLERLDGQFQVVHEIGRASCREKSVDLGGRRIIKKKKKNTAKGPTRC